MTCVIRRVALGELVRGGGVEGKAPAVQERMVAAWDGIGVVI